MTTDSPAFGPVDTDTSDLLDLLAEEHPPIPSVAEEWECYVAALRTAAAGRDGVILPNDLRPHVRGRVAARRIGAFTHRALAAGLVERTGEWEISNDTEGRNSGKPMAVMRWIGPPDTAPPNRGPVTQEVTGPSSSQEGTP